MRLQYALDTSVVAALATGLPSPMIEDGLTDHADAVGVPAPVWHEVLVGARDLPPRQRAAVEALVWDVLFRAFPVIPYDRAAAEWHAAERHRLAQAGGALGFADGAIAAIAVAHNLELVTLVPERYAGFGGLRCAAWGRSLSQPPAELDLSRFDGSALDELSLADLSGLDGDAAEGVSEDDELTDAPR